MKLDLYKLKSLVEETGQAQDNYTLGRLIGDLNRLRKDEAMFKGAMSVLALVLMKTGEVRISKHDLMEDNNYQIIQYEDVETGEVVFQVKEIK